MNEKAQFRVTLRLYLICTRFTQVVEFKCTKMTRDAYLKFASCCNVLYCASSASFVFLGASA
jgi:hypothetical protein